MPAPDIDPEVRRLVVEPSGPAFRDLVEVMARLRAPGGCPWDREQTHASLVRHLVEETYETLDAIEQGDLTALREELGDLLLQVVFHAEIAFEEGAFSVADVLRDLRDKLVRRHPHVFGHARADTAHEVYAGWERNKRAEKEGGTLDDIPRSLPALVRASKVVRRAVAAGFSWDGDDDVVRELEDEVRELGAEVTSSAPDLDRIESELGDVLFSAVCVGQRFGIDAETALRRMVDRFTRRFRALEQAALEDGRSLESLSAAEWAEYWDEAKGKTDA